MKNGRSRICTYLVTLDESTTDGDLTRLAAYLSTLNLVGCEVVVLDPATGPAFARHHRVLRWVGRHLFCDTDILQAATEVAGSEKIIIASKESRYTVLELAATSSLLDTCDAVEPEEFVDPLPWWGAVDAGGLLLQRGLDRPIGTGSTFAFRRSVWRRVPGLEERPVEHPLTRLVNHGAEVHPAREVFVRREPSRLPVWERLRARAARESAAMPLFGALLACLLPMLIILGLAGGLSLAGSYAGIIAFASVLVALRGRVGAGRFFPLRACFLAPVAIIERSLTIYWSIYARMRPPVGTSTHHDGEKAARRVG